ncbi:MAG: hypothetical protein U9N18_05150 [Campylobacterota bacterium]|nr:hypothetical protein [Campylobacterota bacterium]
MDIEKALKDEIDNIFASDYTLDKVEKIIHRVHRSVSRDAFLIVKLGEDVMSLLISQIDGVYHISMETTSLIFEEKKLEKDGQMFHLSEYSSLAETQEKYLILFETKSKEAKILICDELLGRTNLPVDFGKKDDVTFLIRLKCLF